MASASDGELLALVLVVAAHPVLGIVVAGLVAALRDQVQVLVGGVHNVEAPRVRRIGMEDVPAVALAEDADALPIREAGAARTVVVFGGSAGPRVGPERDADVVIEVRAAGREPGECPAHPFGVRRELGLRGPGDRDHGHVARVQMRRGAVEAVRPERAVRAALIPVGREHEVYTISWLRPSNSWERLLV